MHEERQAITLVSHGLKLFCCLHLPLRALKRVSDTVLDQVPGVLFCHGFGGNKSGRYRLSVRLAEQLAASGIAALRVDFRGSGDSEGNFEDTTITSQLEDARIAANFLLSHNAVDPNRFGVLGKSFGGGIATLLAADIPQTKAVALIAPFFDAAPWNPLIQGKVHKKGELAFDEESHNISFAGHLLNKQCLAEILSLNLRDPLAKLAHVPFLLVQGEQDKILDMYHYEQYLSCRNESMAKTDILTLPASDHEFSHFQERELLISTTVNWFLSQL